MNATSLRPERTSQRLAMLALLCLVLLAPAIWNRLPHFFPDSGAYLHVGWGRYWLLDRSSFYGFYLKPFVFSTDVAGLWLALLPQVLATALLLAALAQRLGARHWQWWLPVVVLLGTGPWHASQIMPDALAAVIVVLGWICASRAPDAPGSPSLWLAGVLSCLTHSTFLAVFGSSVLVTLLVLKVGGLQWDQFWKRLLVLAAAVAIIVGTQLFANAHFLGKASYSPKSSAFLYASLNEDGLVEPWLAENCPRDDRIRDLCRIAPSIPRDSQLLLWHPRSVFHNTAWTQRDNQPGIDWDTQLGIAARGALVASPLIFARQAASATIEQFFSYRVLDDECPTICLSYRGAIQHAFHRLRPHLQDRVNSAPQMRGELPRRPIEFVTGLNSHLGLLGLLILIPFAIRRRDVMASSLMLALLGSLMLNAFVTGSLSDVHDRYQSRLIWLCSVVCLLVLLRWARSKRDGESSGEAFPVHARVLVPN